MIFSVRSLPTGSHSNDARKLLKYHGMVALKVLRDSYIDGRKRKHTDTAYSSEGSSIDIVEVERAITAMYCCLLSLID